MHDDRPLSLFILVADLTGRSELEAEGDQVLKRDHLCEAQGRVSHLDLMRMLSNFGI